MDRAYAGTAKSQHGGDYPNRPLLGPLHILEICQNSSGVPKGGPSSACSQSKTRVPGVEEGSRETEVGRFGLEPHRTARNCFHRGNSLPVVDIHDPTGIATLRDCD